MGFVAPDNEHLLKGLSEGERARYMHIRHAAEKIAEERPEMNTGVYTAFLENWLDGAVKNHNELEAVKEKFKETGAQPTYASMKRISDKNSREALLHFQEEIMPKYGKEGEDAMRLLGDRTNESVLGKATKLVYNENEGGIQWGGILGGIAGVALAMFATGGTGGWLGWTMMILGGLMGAWLGNKTGNMISSRTGGQKQPSAPAEEAAKGKARTRELSPEGQERKEAARRVAERLNQSEQNPEISEGQNVDDGESAQLPAPATGKATEKTADSPAVGPG